MCNRTRTLLTFTTAIVLMGTHQILAQWDHYGLENRRVNALEFKTWNTTPDPIDPGTLYACTDSGVYRIEVELPATSWEMFGLAGKVVNTITFADRWLAGLNSGTNLIYQQDNATSWSVTGAGFGGGNSTVVTRIDATAPIPNVHRYVVACGGGDLGRSTDYGRTFTGYWGFFGGFNFVKMDSLRPPTVYAGGMSGLWGPLLLKSVDTAKTWELLMEGYGAPSNPANDIAIHPTSPDTVWLAFEHGIAKSVDGGHTWSNHFSSGDFRFRTIEVDQHRPGYLYASGGLIPGLLTLYISRNGGLSWSSVSDTIPLQNPVADILVISPDSVTNRLYLATERGVFSYTETVPQYSCCVGMRGNVNGMGIVDLIDLTWLVSWLIEPGGYVPRCMESANVNGQGIIDVADLSALASYLTGDGYQLPPCP